jgi:hypothetical protein
MQKFKNKKQVGGVQRSEPVINLIVYFLTIYGILNLLI